MRFTAANFLVFLAFPWKVTSISIITTTPNYNETWGLPSRLKIWMLPQVRLQRCASRHRHSVGVKFLCNPRDERLINYSRR